MTTEDIESQQKDALWSHRQATIVAENARERVNKVAHALRTVAEMLQREPQVFSRGTVVIAGDRKTLPAGYPDAARGVVDFDALVAITTELESAEKEASKAAATAQRLGVVA